MERTLYKRAFTEGSIPEWRCPTCRKGFLKIKPGTFCKEELSESRKLHPHVAWEPEWIEKTYSCLLVCMNDRCKEIVANVGRGAVDCDIVEDEEGNPEQVYCDFFNPLYFHPPLKLIELPKKTPQAVSDALICSFSLFFCNPSAASNHVRTAVEELLTELKVKRYEVTKGQRRRLSLHKRLEYIPPKFQELKDLFTAVKWLGNAGSHSASEIKIDDVMDAYEMMEHLLKEIYEKKTNMIRALAKKVNKSKGPQK